MLMRAKYLPLWPRTRDSIPLSSTLNGIRCRCEPRGAHRRPNRCRRKKRDRCALPSSVRGLGTFRSKFHLDHSRKAGKACAKQRNDLATSLIYPLYSPQGTFTAEPDRLLLRPEPLNNLNIAALYLIPSLRLCEKLVFTIPNRLTLPSLE